MSTIREIKPFSPKEIPCKKVAAYARVSTDNDRQENSLSTQTTYYNDLIKANPEWEYCGVFVDDGVSGTQIKGRDQFNELIKACENHSVDIILTKSISRFARNTIDLLETVRKLKKLGVEIQFEKENIRTLSHEGELLLTLLGSIAQEESRSISENLRWSVKKKYEQGISLNHRCYGYRWNGKKLRVHTTEARVVRQIFSDYMKGKSFARIAEDLNNRGITPSGKPFNKVAIGTILHNERYIGDTRLQKTYCKDFITHKRSINRGNAPSYYAEGTHTPIVKREVFEAVAKEIERRKQLGTLNIKKVIRRCFTGIITCEKCGSKYIRTYKTPTNANWRCSSNRKHGASGCRSIGINEEQLKKLSALMMGQDLFHEQDFINEVDHITAAGDGTFTFHFHDSRVMTKFWKSRSQRKEEKSPWQK